MQCNVLITSAFGQQMFLTKGINYQHITAYSAYIAQAFERARNSFNNALIGLL